MLTEQGERILEICRGHWAANVLFAATDLGLFDVLAGTDSYPAGLSGEEGALAASLQKGDTEAGARRGEVDGRSRPAPAGDMHGTRERAILEDKGAKNSLLRNLGNRHIYGTGVGTSLWGDGLHAGCHASPRCPDTCPVPPGLTAGEAAAALGTDPASTARLLDALAGLGLVVKRGARYANSPAAAHFLVRGKESYLGHAVHHFANLAEGWSRLGEAVRTGRAVGFAAVEREPYEQRLRDYILAMRDNASLKAGALAGIIEAGGCRNMLDLGGGPGSFTIALLKQNRELKATIFDLAPTLEITRELVAAAGLTGRVTLRPGDFTRDGLGEGAYDLVLASNVVHIYDDRTNRGLVSRVYNALRPGGRLVVHDYVLAEVPAPEAALFDLNMLVGTVCGRVYAVAEMSAWLRDAGFEDIDYLSLTAGSGLVTGRKVAR
ncbi:methyltransferase [Desulfotomaculum copahuensis]|uniref:O-methyltransferase domain-containing protein n=1 Tax=Desulfotomaculum copahuensis TaxID=1838280 RepID=A0A1B7LCS8_9FIRM|nr:methyltransferase [Desulfotomaculum copahuensis]OAT80741.1 hypothetical protein A6M21_12870 [Desulfotomaculum copahuensis]